MFKYIESSVKDHLLGPPSYPEVINYQQPITNSYRTSTNTDDIIPSAPVVISTGLIPPQPPRHPCQAIIITAIIVSGIVAIALIVSGTYIFVNHRAISTSTIPTTTTTKRPICFDGDGFVVKEDGSQVKVRDIKIGDQILVAFETAMKSIRFRSSPVLAIDTFQKYNNESPVYFLEIQTESKVHAKPLHITPRHSLLVKKEYDVQMKYLFASEIQIGDYLYIMEDNSQPAIQARVTTIRSIQLFDAYAPLTLEGTLVVNNAVVSCYGTYNHALVHWIMAPRRWLRYIILRIVMSLIRNEFSEKYIDYLHTYFTTIDLYRLFILNSIRDLIVVFE